MKSTSSFFFSTFSRIINHLSTDIQRICRNLHNKPFFAFHRPPLTMQLLHNLLIGNLCQCTLSISRSFSLLYSNYLVPTLHYTSYTKTNRLQWWEPVQLMQQYKHLCNCHIERRFRTFVPCDDLSSQIADLVFAAEAVKPALVPRDFAGSENSL